MAGETENKALASKLDLLNKLYTELSRRRDSLMDALKPWLGDVQAIQPQLVSQIDALTQQMMVLVERSDELLQELQNADDAAQDFSPPRS